MNRIRLSILATTAGLSGLLPAQTLLKDFNQTPSTQAGSSGPQAFQPGPFGGLLFTASTPETGRELWFTDSSAPGTTMLADIFPGPNSSDISGFTELPNGLYLFTATNSANGTELWRTDGSPAGTTLVLDIQPGPGSSRPRELTLVGNQVIFFADDGVHGLEPWRTDGTAAGTNLIVDIEPGAISLTIGSTCMASLPNGRCVFGARANGSWNVWISDLTAQGTSPIYALPAALILTPRQFTSFGNRVLFEAEDGWFNVDKYVTDGTPSGTSWLPGASSGEFQVAGNLAYFRGWDPAKGQELWKTDGTIAGTSLVIDLDPVTSIFNGGRPTFVGTLQGDVYFFGSDPAGRHLFRSDGTRAGTVALSDTASVGFSDPGRIGFVSNGYLYYHVAGFGTDLRLWRTDGTIAGTTPASDLQVDSFGAIGPALLLGASDGTQTGSELWVSDGTPLGTQLFLDIVPPPVSESATIYLVGNLGDRVVARADDGVHGEELWLTDGTPQGTQLMVDLVPGSGSPTFRGFAANDERALVLATTPGNDGDPWFSDGTPAGTAQLDILPANSGFQGKYATSWGSRFVFTGRLPTTGDEPWITDGTVSGTYALADVYPGTNDSHPGAWYVFDDFLLFTAYDQDGYGIWRTDGTPAGTAKITSPANLAGDGTAFRPVRFGNHIYFAGRTSTQGIELWRTDGTPAGTSQVADLNPGFGGSHPYNLVRVPNGIVFNVLFDIWTPSSQLVFTDGTAAGTTFLALPDDEFEGPFEIDGQNALLFLPSAAGYGHDFWRTDGTPAGTVPFGSGRRLGAPTKLGAERTMLVMDDGVSGLELWSTDGTSSGTELVVDLGPGDSLPYYRMRAGNQLIIYGTDGVHGHELFSAPFAASNDWAVEVYGSGCPGTNGVTPSIGYDGAARVSSAQPFRLVMRDALPNTLALLAWSTERGATAIPGCTIGLTGQIDVLATVTDPNGQATLPVFPTPSLLGFKLDAQFFGLDPAGSALGFLSATPAIEFVFGP